MRWIVFVIAAVLIFTVFVSVYAASASRAEVRLLPKWLWVLLCIFLPPIGGLLYLVTGRPLGSGGSSRARGPRGARTVAPDDDPEFLRNLADKLKRDEAPKTEETKDVEAAQGSEAAGAAQPEGERPGGEPDQGENGKDNPSDSDKKG